MHSQKIVSINSKDGVSRTGETARVGQKVTHEWSANKSDSLRGDVWRAVAAVFSLLICWALLLPHNALAQEFRGTISGLVTDPSGAVVPGASVQVLETHTGTISKTVSDHKGQYVVPFLTPGNYSITATMPGFQTLRRSDVTLQTLDHLIINLTLTVGQESRTVVVTGGAPLLDMANSSVGDVIESKSVEDVAVDGRTPEMLAEMAVGVTTTNIPHMVRPYDADDPWSMGGAIATPNNGTFGAETLLDGGPDEDFDGGTAYSPPMDAAQEVSVQPFDTDAAYGHTTSGVVNVTTKSGTNGFHGTAYEYYAISALDANTFFDDRAVPVIPTPVQHYNQYGLTAGGPVLIPKVLNGRNKLFFFFSWEGIKQVQPEEFIFSVPTDAEKEGDFSAMLAGGPSYQLYEPNTGTLSNGKFTRTPVPNNCLTNKSSYCSSVANAGITIDPIAAAYLKLYSEPNYTSGVSPITNEDNYNSNVPDTLTFNGFLGRMDYNLSARDHVFFDIRHNYGYFTELNYFKNDSSGYANPRWNWGTMLDNVFAMNPTTVFDVRLNSMVHTNREYVISNGTSVNPTSVGFPSYMQSASDFVVLPEIVLSTGGSQNTTGFEEIAQNGSQKLSTAVSYQVFADMIKTQGRHLLKIGFDGRQYRERNMNPGDSSGAFTFSHNFVDSGTSGVAQPCCYDLASFEYGLPTSGDYQLTPNGDFRTYYIASFVQDDWTVNKHLTLNMGLRYEIGTPWGEKWGRTISGWNPTAVNSASAAAAAAFTPTSVTVNDTTVSVGSINTLGGVTFPSSDWGAPYQIKNNAGFWSPRFGFSYNPARAKSTVVRGGFGLFAIPQSISKGGDGGYINQEGFAATTAFAATSNNYFTNQSTLDNPFPTGIAQPFGSSQGASTFLGSPSSISFLAPVEHDMYAERWTLDLQHELSGNTMLEVFYEGNHGVYLPVSNNINATERQYLTTNPYGDQNLSTAYSSAVHNPFAGLLPNGTSSYNGATTPLSNLLVPYPAYGSASITEEDMTIGQSFFESGGVHVEQRASHGLTLTANFQYAKLIEQDTYLNPEDTKLWRGVSLNDDMRYHLTVSGVYELPFGRGKLFSLGGGTVANEIAGGWVVTGIYQFQTGLPIDFKGDIPLQPGMTIRDNKSQPRNASATTPALSTSVFVTGSNTCVVSAGQLCDGTVFSNRQYFDHYRTLPYTMDWVRQDGWNNLDASMLKNFNFTEKAYLQLRFETFNALNHPAFGTPNLTPTSSGFGHITSVFGSAIPRNVQLGARIVF